MKLTSKVVIKIEYLYPCHRYIKSGHINIKALIVNNWIFEHSNRLSLYNVRGSIPESFIRTVNQDRESTRSNQCVGFSMLQCNT